MKVGDKLEAKWTETFVDHVTNGKMYEVVEVLDFTYTKFFKIRNDKGEVSMPVSTSFNLVKNA